MPFVRFKSFGGFKEHGLGIPLSSSYHVGQNRHECTRIGPQVSTNLKLCVCVLLLRTVIRASQTVSQNSFTVSHLPRTLISESVSLPNQNRRQIKITVNESGLNVNRLNNE